MILLKEKVWKISLEVDELDLRELLCSSTPLGIFYNSLLYLAFLSNFKVLKKKENYASFLQNKRVWKGELWWGPNYTAEEEKEVCLSDVWSYSSFVFPCYLFFAGESKNPIFKVVKADFLWLFFRQNFKFSEYVNESWPSGKVQYGNKTQQVCF